MRTDSLRKKGASKRGSKAVEYAGWRPDIEILFVVGMVIATLLLVSPAMAQEGEAKIRMAHLSPDAPAVMVELDGEPVEALASVSYKDSTPYLPIPAGPHDIAVFAVADPSEPVLEVSVAPEAGASYTVAGVGLLEDDSFGARLFEDDTSEPDEGEARVRVIHAIPDVGPATVGVADGPDLFSLPGFANASDYAGVEAGSYTLDVTPAGAEDPAFDIPDVEVEEGEIYTAFAVGQASEGTVGAMMTVDSDNGRIVGPTSLEDTSGDLSLLNETAPQPERASSPVAPGGSGAESAKEPDSPTPERKNTESKEAADEAPDSGNSGQAAESAPAETYQAPAPIQTYQAPAPTYQAPAPTYAPAYTPPPVEQPAVVVPTVEEVVVETVGDTGFVPQPVPAAPAVVPQAPLPQAPLPQAPLPQAPLPAVEIPPVPTVSGSWSSQTTVSTQTVTSSGAAINSVPAGGVATSGFVPPAPPVPTAQQAAVQTVSQQMPGGGVGGAPVGGVVGMVVSNPAVVNSGARRRFVTIRRRDVPGSAA